MKEGIKKIFSSNSKTFSLFCCFFILSSGVASVLDIKFTNILYFFIYLILAALILSWNKKKFRYAFVSLLFISLGLFRFSLTFPNCSDSKDLCYLNGEEVTFSGYVSEEPEIKVDKTIYTISGINVKNGGVSGKVRVQNRLYPSYKYGDVLKVRCKLEEPKGESFRYDKYLARHGVWSMCNYAYIEKIDSDQGNFLLRSTLKLKFSINENLFNLWNEPEASLMAGLLYGGKSGLPKFITEYFSKTGTSHIMAISGFNITILIMILMNSFIFLGFYRRQAFYLLILVIIFFLIFSGMSSSAVRAGIMGVVVLLGQQLGRGTKSFYILIFTAFLMQLYNPYLLVWDIGFQLSFLSLIGLIYVSPFMNKYAIHIFEKNEIAKFFHETLMSTLSAIVMTLPLILYYFGTFSLIAPVSNLLILWIIPWLMLIGSLSLVLSFVYFPFAKLLSYLGHFGLSYVIMVVKFFGEKNWTNYNLKISLFSLTSIYLIFFYLIFKYKKLIWEKERLR